MISRSDSFIPPSGTDAQRPTGVAGMQRYNTTANKLEYYNGTGWVQLSSSSPASGAAGYIQFSNGSTFASDSGLFWDNTNKRLGVGTTGPAGALDVVGVGRFRAEATFGSAVALTGRAADGASFLQFADTTWATEYAKIRSDNTSSLQFMTGSGGTERMRINSSGNVGIGTDAPSQKLDVNGYVAIRSINGEGGTIQLQGNNGTNMWLENINGVFRLVNSGWTAGIFGVDQVGNTTANGYLNAVGGLQENGTALTSKYAYVGGANASGTWGISITGTAQNANQLIGKNWYWSGQGGQPSWLWGGSDGTNMYVYNPSNFVVSNVTALSGTWDGINYFRSNKGAGSYVGGQSSYALEAFSNDGGAAGMSFHRGGAYAVNFGLDPDNVLRIGGWSAGANLWQLNMSGTQWLAGGLYTGGGGYFGTDGNIYMPWLGDWMSNRLNQDVRNGANPTFSDPYVNNWVRINGGGGIYWQAFGGGWYMQDGTWIRSYGGKPVFMDTGFDTGGASGVGCWGGLGGGFTFRVCGSSNTTGDAYAANFYHNSDARLKDNIKAASGLETVMQMKGVTFTWKKDGVKSGGVIAQEIEKIMPEAVIVKPDGFKAVSYDTLIAPMIEAIKDLKKLFDGLSAKVAELFTRIDSHDKELKALRDELKELHGEFTKYKAAHP